MMKKLGAFITVLLVLGCFAFADVSVKDLGGGKIEVTFFYGNPKATDVTIAGDFTNWQAGTLPMTKVEKGWEYKTTVAPGTVMKYKFISDGNWTTDIKAPDTIDDGFGGKNGLVDVNALLAASAPAAAGSAAAVAAPTAKIKFQTWSHFGVASKFNTIGTDTTDKGLDSTMVGLKSYWKFGGNITPNVPVYVELSLAETGDDTDGTPIYLYKKGTTQLNDGLNSLVSNTLTNPVYYWNGQSATATKLGHFKSGITTQYVEWTTGYNYAKLTPHNNVSWTTVDKEWDAGYSGVGGFNIFSLGQSLQHVGDLTINATIAPNRTADRAGNQYGLYSFVNAQYGKHYVDFQYNGAYGKEFKTMFNQVYENDYIAGYSSSFGPVGVKANALFNRYGSSETATGKVPYAPASSDVGNVNDDAKFIENFASNFQAIYTADKYTVTLGYRNRGSQANLMYVKQADTKTDITDTLGDRNVQRFWLDGSYKVSSDVSVGLNPYVQNTFYKDSLFLHYNDKDNMNYFVKPYATVGLKSVTGFDSAVSAYGKTEYNTKSDDKFVRGTKANSTIFEEGGLYYSASKINDTIQGVDVWYGYDNNDTYQLFNTLIAQVKLPQNLAFNGGFGVRTDWDKDASIAAGYTEASKVPVGFFVGMSKKLPILQKPVFYTQFVYNMDPYKNFGDGHDLFNLDGYVTDDGVKDYAGAAAVRVGLGWDF